MKHSDSTINKTAKISGLNWSVAFVASALRAGCRFSSMLGGMYILLGKSAYATAKGLIIPGQHIGHRRDKAIPFLGYQAANVHRIPPLLQGNDRVLRAVI